MNWADLYPTSHEKIGCLITLVYEECQKHKELHNSIVYIDVIEEYIANSWVI